MFITQPRTYFEKHFKHDWRQENATITSYAQAHHAAAAAAAASAFLTPVAPPLQLLPSTSKIEHGNIHRPMTSHAIPGPAPTFR